MARNTREQAEALIKLVGEDQVSKMIEGIVQKVEKIGEKTEESASKTKKFAGGWGKAATGMAAALNIAGMIVSAMESMIATMKEAAAVEGLKSAFDQIHGGAAKSAFAIRQLEEATSGTVSAVGLREAANLAMTAGLTMEQTTELFALATQAALENGKSTEEFVKRFATAMATHSDEVFKSIGAHVNFGQELGRVAKSVGISAEAIKGKRRTQIELKHALDGTRKALGSSSIAIKGQAAEVARLQKEWTDLHDSMKKLVLYLTGVPREIKNLILGRHISGTAGVRQHPIVGTASAKAWADNQKAVQAYADSLGLGKLRGQEFGEVQRMMIAAQKKQKEALEKSTKAGKDNGVSLEDRAALLAEHEKFLRETITAEEDQRLALVENATKMAEMADQMGLTVLASKKWAQAVRAADGDTSLFNRTIGRWIASAKSAVEWAKRFDVAVSGGKPGDKDKKDKKDPKKPTGGRRKKKWKPGKWGTGALISDKRAEVEGGRILAEAAALDQMIEVTQRLTKAREALKTAGGLPGTDWSKEQSGMEAMLEKEQLRLEFLRAQLEVRRSMTEADAAGWDELIFEDQNIEDSTKTLSDSEKGIKSWNKAMTESGGAAASRGVIDAIGAISGNVQLHAGLMGAFEVAESIREFVGQNYAAGVGHLAASVAYFAAAGTAGAGASGGGGGGRPPAPTRPLSLGAPDQKSEKGGMSVTLNLSGATIIGGNERQVGADLARMVQQGLSRRGRDLDLEYVPG